MKQILLFPLLLLWGSVLSAQTFFVDQTRLLTPAKHYSGVAIAILDMDGDGRDDIARMDEGNIVNIAHQNVPNQPFGHLVVGPVADDSQWGICAADVDNNGMGDLMTGGSYDGVKILRANADGTAFNTTLYNSPSTFVQGVNFADINNDGWLDAFVCHDDAESRIYGNNGDGTFTYQPTWMDLTTVPVSDNSGNYGSVWSDVDNDGDLDLYIAKCRQGVNDPTDPRRINQLFWNNGNGTYTQDTSNLSGLRIGAQSWTADFGDIDNDGDFDCFITNHDVPSQLLENDGAGHFTDISATANLLDSITGLPIQGVFRDFDNDGFVDILIAGSEHHIFHNNGNRTFTQVVGLFDDHQIESFAVGDLNHDGFQDIYAGYAGIYTNPSNIPDALWMNRRNNNHFFGLTLQGVQSNRSAVGAKVTLYSALGIQVREVRSGESYGISNSLQIHFGMGHLTQIDSVVVRWPSGQVDKLYQPIVDQYFIFKETGCLLPSVSISSVGSAVFCTGQTVTLMAPAGYTYLWNTGDSTQNILADTAATYRVTVTSAEGCTTVSNRLTTIVDPNETPTITAEGALRFCAGGTVTLTASPAVAYLWSNGATTPSITIGNTADYVVTTQGLCASFTSDTVRVEALVAAPVPVAIGDTVALNTAATLTATGDETLWYAALHDSTALYTGSPFATPLLAETTTYWVAAAAVYDEPNQHAGVLNHSGSAFGSAQYNGQIIFNCYTPCRLAQVKVYSTKVAERKIVLYSSDGTILASKTVAIPNGASQVELDFDLPVDNDLILTTDETVNMANLGTTGPQLRRSDSNVNYPYMLPNVLTITNSNLSSDRYYYFYDWDIDFYGLQCASERVPVLAVVDSSLIKTQVPTWATGLHLSPNPTNGPVRLQLDDFAGGDVTISIRTAPGATLQTQRLTVPPGIFQWQGDLGRYPAGVYWIELAGDQGLMYRKIIVED